MASGMLLLALHASLAPAQTSDFAAGWNHRARTPVRAWFPTCMSIAVA
eukprot:COSAG01_NODE_46779_length_397_cov_0.681208_1_plen_47_part_10